MALQKLTSGIIQDNAVTGSKISVATPSVGDILYYNGTEYTKLAIGAEGEVLQLDDGLPVWEVSDAVQSGAIPGFPFHGNHWFYGGNFGSVTGNTILYHSFTSDNHAIVGHNAAVGSTAMPDINSAMSMSSATEAVVTSGYRGSGILDVTEKFAYASATTAMNGATDISQSFGTLGSPPIFGSGGYSCESGTHGYIGGGRSGELSSFGYADPNAYVRKFEFATGNVTVGIATLEDVKTGHLAVSSQTDGFWCAGHYGHANSQNPYSTRSIDKFTFASENMQHNWDSLSDDRMNGATGSSSTTHGYMYGGHICCYQPGEGTAITTIEKFSFASSGQKTNHGDISTTVGRSGPTGGQTQTHGYEIAGYEYGTGLLLTTVDGYSFSSNTTATQTADIGITVDNAACGCQAPTFSFS